MNSDFVRYRVARGVSGLVNQINMIMNGILQSWLENRRVLILTGFRPANTEDVTVPIGDILDLDALNTFTQSKFNLCVLDETDCELTIQNARYGHVWLHYDVTTIVKEWQQTRRTIPTSSPLNQIWADVYPNHRKQLFVECTFGGKQPRSVCLSYEEAHNRDILFHLDDLPIVDVDPLEHSMCNTQYTELVRALQWTRNFYDSYVSIAALEEHNKKRIVAVHLRVEPDAVQHWKSRNKMSDVDFAIALNARYVALVTQHCTPDHDVLLCLTNGPCEVIDQLRALGYECIAPAKIYGEREYNAIMDSIYATRAANLFIGAAGSTFSSFLARRLASPGFTSIMIRMNHIADNPIVWKDSDTPPLLPFIWYT